MVDAHGKEPCSPAWWAIMAKLGPTKDWVCVRCESRVSERRVVPGLDDDGTICPACPICGSLLDPWIDEAELKMSAKKLSGRIKGIVELAHERARLLAKSPRTEEDDRRLAQIEMIWELERKGRSV